MFGVSSTSKRGASNRSFGLCRGSKLRDDGLLAGEIESDSQEEAVGWGSSAVAFALALDCNGN